MTVSKCLVTVGTDEAIRMPLLSNSIQAIPFDSAVTLRANGSQVGFIAGFTIQLALFLYEPNILETSATGAVGAHEVIGTPGLSKGSDERASDR